MFWIKEAKKIAYGGEIDINPVSSVHRVGYDFDKATVKVSGVNWISF